MNRREWKVKRREREREEVERGEAGRKGEGEREFNGE